MNFLHKIKIKGFNQRSLDEMDAYWFCEDEGITVIEAEVMTSFYFVCKGKPFIVLKKNQIALKKLFDFWHEIAHHCIHSGRAYESYFFGLIECKNETEANAVATVCIVPKKALYSYEFLDSFPRSRFAVKLFKDRQRLEFLYRI